MPAPITDTTILPPGNRRPPFTDDSYISGATWDNPFFQDVVMQKPSDKVAWFDKFTEFD